MSSSIADIQSKKEAEIQPKYASPTDSQNEVTLRKQSEADAAKTLQRTYRGYRARRQLQGLSLDPASRWIEAVKEAQYRALTTPQSRGTDTNTISSTTDPSSPPFPQPGLQHRTSTAKSNWAFAGKIARRANKAEDSSPSGSSSSDSDVGAHDVSNTPTSARPPTDAQKRARKQKKLAEKQDRVKSAKTMDLSYFLEMVDQKHRYGSNLRKYHAYWKAQEGVYENFFFWLDHGAGKDVVVEACSRERLEEMRVRYLGKEERRLYEVVVGEGGSLWRDSVEGIVRVEDAAPLWADRRRYWERGSSEGSGMDSEEERAELEVVGGQKEEKGETEVKKEDEKGGRKGSIRDAFGKPKAEKPKKSKQIWIFVADTKNNLYIGLKQSGAFQHSSFLHGSRVSVAGLIHVKDGQLRMLEPRSGHYKTPSHNLHIFIKSLQSRGVDMSIAAVPGSYAAMVGIQGYMKTKGRWKEIKDGVRGIVVGGGKKEGGKEKGKEGEGVEGKS